MRNLMLMIAAVGSAYASDIPVIDTCDAQKYQQAFDDQFFEINTDFEKLRHILLHLMKTVGKFATYCEAKEHGKDADRLPLVDEVLPDLLIHALQIANAHGIDLGEKYLERIKFLVARNMKQMQHEAAQK